MSEETLLTAARRVVRFFNIDMNNGGIITVDTQGLRRDAGQDGAA